MKGRFLAASSSAASALLTCTGYQLIELQPVPQFINWERISAAFSRVKPVEIVLFYRQLALLLESGVDIATSLELLHSQTFNRTLTTVLGEVISDLRGGSQLSAALSKHPKIFLPICCQTLCIGEQTGNLETMLRQIVDYMEKDIETAKGIKGALMYPIITAVVAVMVVGVLVTFVFPAFSSLYASLGAELPLITRVTISAADILRKYGIYFLLVALILSSAAFLYSKTRDGRYQKDKLALKIPIIGRISHLKELARCCRSVSLLFRAGLPMTAIMLSVIDSSGNLVIKEALRRVQQEVLGGAGLSHAMAQSEYFLPMMVQMVSVGEATGNLDATLLATAQNYETEADYRTRSLVGYIEPAITLAIGILVALIALALMSAMYSMYGQVG